MRFLIVDDNKAMRLIIKRTLRQAGFEDVTVDEAVSGVDALESIQRSVPDLVLSDWNMPEMSGLDFLKKLRELNINVTFGFITSESTPDMQQLATSAGAQFFISKPFTAESLQAALGTALS
jgi:two-component system, chemotaxis family, chemotaxis protein CheY